MAWITVRFFSMTLGQTTAMEVLLPEPDRGIGVTPAVWDGETPLPVLYLLHGHSDDQTIWMRRTAIERMVAGRRLAVVMPCGNRSYYVDHKCGYAWYSFLTEELPQIVRRFFKISSRREDTYIAGLSMGGYGAMRAGLGKPEFYSKVISMSGALDLTKSPSNMAFDDALCRDAAAMAELRKKDPVRYYTLIDLMQAFGSKAEFIGSENDLCALLRTRIEEKAQLPEFHLSIGSEDFLVPGNEAFRSILDEAGVPYLHTVKPGAHEWSFWDAILPEVLDWLSPIVYKDR